MKRASLSCYVKFPKNEQEDGNDYEWICVECKRPKDSLEELKAHLAWDHMDWCPFQCPYCPVCRPTAFTTQLHIDEAHPDKDFKYIHTPNADKEEYLIERFNLSVGNRRPCFNDSAPIKSAQSMNSSSTRLCLSTLDTPILASTPVTQKKKKTQNRIAPTESRSNTYTKFKFSAAACEPTVDSSVNEEPVIYCGANVKQEVTECAETDSKPVELSMKFCVKCGGSLPESKIPEHIFKIHLKEKMFLCPHCDFGVTFDKSELTEHILSNHPKESPRNFVDLQANFYQKYLHVLSDCFPVAKNAKKSSENAPSSACASAESVGPELLKCAKCRSAVPVNEAEEHILTVHSKTMILFCGYCNFGCKYNPDGMKTHLAAAHSEKPAKFSDERSRYASETQKLWEECFGPKTPRVRRRKNCFAGEREALFKKGTPNQGGFCLICKKRVLQKRSHIFNNHFNNRKTVLCGYCDYGTKYNTTNVCRHITRVDPEGHPDKVIDNRQDYFEEVDQIARSCFGI